MAIDRYTPHDVGPPVASTLITYVVWFFLGMFGGHRFLTGRVFSGFAMLVLHGLGWLTWWFGLGFIFFGVLGLWWLIDAFLIPGWLDRR
jgi:TM2 domain-containing membrane protein YozV